MTPVAPLEPVVLEGMLIRLEPMTPAHLDGLAEVGLDPEIWRLTVVNPRTRADIRDYMESGLATLRDGSGLPFVTMLKDSRRIVGSTRFGNYDPPNLASRSGGHGSQSSGRSFWLLRKKKPRRVFSGGSDISTIRTARARTRA